MSYTAVQFYGIDSVLEAYGSKKTPAFAIWCGKSMLLRYDGTEDGGKEKPTMEEGSQILEQYLKSMYSGTTATYTLKTYDELKPGQKIRPSTEYDTAFQFKISEPPIERGYYPPERTSPFLNELKLLREEVAQMRQPIEEDDIPETLEEAAIGLIHNPEKLQAFVEPLRQLAEIGKMIFSPGLAMQPARMGNNAITDRPPIDQQTTLQRLGQAIDLLEKHDKKLVDHLEALARIAEK